MHCIYCVVCFTRTKVNDSASLNDCVTKNGQVNAVTMKDVVDACCNAKRESIVVNMEAAATVGNIKEVTHANGKDETDLLIRVPGRLVGTGKSDIGINAMDDTVFAATAIDVVQMKGMISFIFFVEQFQVPFEFLIFQIVCLIAFVKL